MLLQAALNGPYTKTHHPAVPMTAAELAADAQACRRAGAGAFHLHPRDADGIERMAAAVVDQVVRTVRTGLATVAAIHRVLDDAGSNAELVAAAYALGAGRA